METIKHINQREKWVAVIEEQKASGLSQAAFCKEKNISYTMFNYHRNALIKKTEITSGQHLFSPIHLKKIESSPVLEIRIVIPNGYQCFIPSQIDPLQLKQIVEVLLAC